MKDRGWSSFWQSTGAGGFINPDFSHYNNEEMMAQIEKNKAERLRQEAEEEAEVQSDLIKLKEDVGKISTGTYLSIAIIGGLVIYGGLKYFKVIK